MQLTKIMAIGIIAAALNITAYSAELDTGMTAFKAGRYTEALKILVPLANARDSEAQRVVGEMCFNGQGIKRDTFAAFKWNELAAASGDRIAQYNIGYLFEKGEGVSASHTEAINWYTKAAIQEYIPAQRKLGDLYAGSDRSKAIYWYDKARQGGDEVARNRFAELSSNRVAEINAEHKRSAEQYAQVRKEEQREADAERAVQQARADDDRQSTRDYNAAIGAQILQGINDNGARLANIDRQTSAAYAETNRRLAAQAAERKHAREEQEEHEAERRRDARRSEEARQSRERLAQADARDREDQRRKETERAAERQREEQRRKDQQAQQGRTGVSLSSSASTATGSSAQKDGATKTRLPHKPYAEPNPYDKGFLGGNTEVGKEAGWSSHSAGNGQTREAACSEARKKSQQEIARLSAHWRFDATSPCVCSVNVSADRSMLDAMAETGEPDHWFCAMYEKKTQIRDLGSRSR